MAGHDVGGTLCHPEHDSLDLRFERMESGVGNPVEHDGRARDDLMRGGRVRSSRAAVNCAVLVDDQMAQAEYVIRHSVRRHQPMRHACSACSRAALNQTARTAKDRRVVPAEGCQQERDSGGGQNEQPSERVAHTGGASSDALVRHRPILFEQPDAPTIRSSGSPRMGNCSASAGQVSSSIWQSGNG